MAGFKWYKKENPLHGWFVTPANNTSIRFGRPDQEPFSGIEIDSLPELENRLKDNLPFGLLASCTVALTKCIPTLSLQDARACLVSRTANVRAALKNGKFNAFLKSLKEKVVTKS